MILPNPMELMIILVVVALLFGTGKIKNIGKDLGTAIKDFKSTMSEPEKKDTPAPSEKKAGE